MQAIITRFANDAKWHGVIEATCAGKQVRVAYDRTLGLDDNHVTAALQLATSLGWRYEWAFAKLPLGDYAHVPLRPDRSYSTLCTETYASPAEEWRGRSSLSTSRRR